MAAPSSAERHRLRQREHFDAVPIPLVNRWPSLLGLEARLNRVRGLRLGCAVQIVRGVRA